MIESVGIVTVQRDGAIAGGDGFSIPRQFVQQPSARQMTGGGARPQNQRTILGFPSAPS